LKVALGLASFCHQYVSGEVEPHTSISKFSKVRFCEVSKEKHIKLVLQIIYIYIYLVGGFNPSEKY